MSEMAIFAAGCFWGVEAAFRKIEGVIDVEAGYTGGTVSNPTYHDVCSGTTGHAEAVRVEYDPRLVSYKRLLDVFFTIHDPTQRDRQGPDVGRQYRSGVFFRSPEQETEARAAIKALDDAGRFPRPVATEVTAAGPFWRAEEYHQRYVEKKSRFR